MKGQLLQHPSQSDARHMWQLWCETVLCRRGAPHVRCITAQLENLLVRDLLSLLCMSGRLLSLSLCHLHCTLRCAGLRLQLLVVLNDSACVQDELLGVTLQEQGLSGHAAGGRGAACCSDVACWQAT